MDQRYILLGGAATLLIRVAGTAMITVLTILVARELGATAYGHFAFFLSLVFVAALFGTLGLPAAANLFVVRYRSRSWQAHARHYVAFSFAVSALATLAAASTGILALKLFPPTAHLLPLSLAPMIGYALAVAWLRLSVDVARALGHPVAAALAEQQLFGRLMMLTALAVMSAAGANLTADRALYLWIAGALVAVIVIAGRIARSVGRPSGSGVARPYRRYRLWLSVSTTMLITPVFFFIVSETDVLTIGFFRDASEVGIYNVARRLAEVTQFAHAAVVALVMPRLAQAYGQRDTKRMQTCVDTMCIAALLPGCAAIAVLVIFRHAFLSLFGPEFVAGQGVLLIMCATRLIDMSLGPASEILMMSGRHVIASRINIVFSVLNIAMNLLLVPRFGMTGAAVATLITITLWKLTLLVPCRKTGVQAVPIVRGIAWIGHWRSARARGYHRPPDDGPSERSDVG